MIKNLSSVKIGTIWNQGTGSTFKDEIDASPTLGPDAILTKPITGQLTLIRLKDSVTAMLEDVSTETELVCSRCLEKFNFPIYLNNSEREFFEAMPERGYDPFETFLINKQDMSIDMTESLRQEIILHFPMVPVHSERCKGLCPGCHVNLNGKGKIPAKHAPGCTETEVKIEEDSATHKPFSNLKDLFKK
jgi:uncharacterized metal-binding protein YceD (DUF177 family)